MSYTWPDGLPAPKRTVNVALGTNWKGTTMLSGRRTMRRWGHVPPDTATVQFRINREQFNTLSFFWHRVGLDGIWFEADWLETLGYDDHKCRFLGLPKRKSIDGNWSDFSATILIQKAELCPIVEPWKSEAGGGGTGGGAYARKPLICIADVYRPTGFEYDTPPLPTITFTTRVE